MAAYSDNSRKTSYRGTGSRILDGVRVRLNDKCLPPNRVTLPLHFEVGNPAEILFLEYNFELEEQVVAVSDIVRQKWEEEMRQAIARQQREEEEQRAAEAAAAAEAERQRELEIEKQKQLSSLAESNDKLSLDKDKEVQSLASAKLKSLENSDTVDSSSLPVDEITNSNSAVDSREQLEKDSSSSEATSSSTNVNNSHAVVSAQSLSPPGESKPVPQQQPAVESAPALPAPLQQTNFVGMTPLLPATQYAFHAGNVNAASLSVNNGPTSGAAVSAPSLHWMPPHHPPQMWHQQQQHAAALGGSVPVAAFKNSQTASVGMGSSLQSREAAAWAEREQALYGSILKPQLVAPGNKSTTSPKDAPPASQPLDLRDFDKQQDPFEQLELETLDDREVLKQVLSQTGTAAAALPTNRSDSGLVTGSSLAANSNAVSLGQRQQQHASFAGSHQMPYHQQMNFYRHPDVAAMLARPPFVSGAATLVNGDTTFVRPNLAGATSHLSAGYFPGSYQPHMQSGYGAYYGASQHLQRPSGTSISQPNAPPPVASNAYTITNQFVPAHQQRNALSNTNPWKQDLYSRSVPKSTDVGGFGPLASDGYGQLGGRFSMTGRHSEVPPRQTLRSAKSWTDIRDAVRDEEERSNARRSIGKSSKTPPPYADSDRLDHYTSSNPPLPVRDLHKNLQSTECTTSRAGVDGLAGPASSGVGVNGGWSSGPYLSADARRLVDRMTDMGFDKQLVVRAVERLGVASEQQIFDHLCLVNKLRDRGFKQADAELASLQYGQKENKAVAYLEAQRRFQEMGFHDDRINTALVSYNLDHDKVLDALMSSS